MIHRRSAAVSRWSLGARLPAVSRWLMVAGLAALLPFARPPYFVVALAALGLHLGLHLGLLARRSAAYKLLVVLTNVAALPFVAGSILPRGDLAVLLVIPGLPWLAASLERAAASIVAREVPVGIRGPSGHDLWLRLPRGRWATPYLLAVGLGLLAQAFIGIVAAQAVLVGTAVALLGFLGILVGVSFVRIPPVFLTALAPTVRVLARDTVEVTVALSSRARSRVGILMEEPHGWVRIAPPAFVMDGEAPPSRVGIAPPAAMTDGREVQVRVRLTPPLAGPSTVRATAVAVDPWGLTALRQDVDLVQLRVIPRAAYAAWLARRYLEQTRGGALAAVTVPETHHRGSVRRGLDYHGARLYEPGDALKDIFWKHTLRLRQLVVKERRDEHGEAVIVAANLSAGDPDQADELAYTLLMSALTLAREGVPLAYAAYTATDVVAVTPALAPREAVGHALSLVEGVRITPVAARVLQAPQVARLRRNIARLGGAGGEPAVRLARILGFELQALLSRAQVHPAATALRRVASQVGPPAAVLVVSPAIEEADVLDVTLERLKGKGFHLIHPVAGDGQAGARNEQGGGLSRHPTPRRAGKGFRAGTERRRHSIVTTTPG